jgi:hypothetical protein
MLSIKRCPHTGIVNLFDTTDPHIAIGSIARSVGPANYLWRCYAQGDARSGIAVDLKAAEHALIACFEDAAEVGRLQVRAA